MNNSQAHINKGYFEDYFFSPRPDHRVHNNYINSFYHHLTQKVGVLNQHDKVMGRSTELMKYALKAKVLILNWPEDIVHLRFGWLQAICFNLAVLLVKAKGGKVVWVCHNKKSHATGKVWLGQLNRGFFMHIADKIIVHSRDAVTTLKEVRQKTIFLPHPRYERIASASAGSNNKRQALIWGNITPYKGLEEFIEDYKKWQAQIPVHIVGNGPAAYISRLQNKAAGTPITIQNARLTELQLHQAFDKSSVIVLPYQKTDTFSSGALIHSLNANKIILGPRVGNFIDLAETGACIAYRDNEELFALLNRLYQDPAYYQEQLQKAQAGMNLYYEQNTWERMVAQVVDSIQPKKGKVNVRIMDAQASSKQEV